MRPPLPGGRRDLRTLLVDPAFDDVDDVDDVDEAVAIANDSDYGLGGALWSQNLSTALRVVNGVHSGTMWVNCYGLIAPMAGFNGTKLSGYGAKGSAEHMDHYLYTKCVYIQR